MGYCNAIYDAWMAAKQNPDENPKKRMRSKTVDKDQASLMKWARTKANEPS